MIKSYDLSNGIRVITESIPHFRSASIGLWFGVGSVYENEEEKGLSHFIEHMLFKGTKTRTAKQIAEVMDSVGGQLNAFTAKEYTCFYCKVMDEHIEMGLELLSDMLLNSTIDGAELEKEKGVILEEINMYDDSPEDLVHEELSKAFFGNHPLASPILGTVELLEGYKSADLTDYMNKFYTPDNLVVSIAGNFSEPKLLEWLNKYLGGWKSTKKTFQQVSVPEDSYEIRHIKKDIEQVHVSLAFPGLRTGSEELYTMSILNNILGGSMSSRLFQKIREDKGLAYSVFSYPSNYLSGGMFSIYAGMKPSQTATVLGLIIDEINLLKKNAITQDEFVMAREQLKGNYILGMESTNSRMNSLGRSKLLLNKIVTPSEVIDKINRVTIDNVVELIAALFGGEKIAAAAVGKEDIRSTIENVI